MPKIEALAAHSLAWPGLCRIILFLVHSTEGERYFCLVVDSRDSHRVARKCSGTGGRCSVSGQQHVHPKASASPQRTYPLRGMRDYSFNASKDIGMGVTDLALACGSEPVFDAVFAAVVGSARTGRLLDAGSGRED